MLLSAFLALCSHVIRQACGGAQLCDLGLSHLLTSGTHVTTKTYGTIAFQPVELLRDGKLSKAVDVYSFAMITWEVYTGERIYADSIPSQVGFRATPPARRARAQGAACAAVPSAPPCYPKALQCRQHSRAGATTRQ